MFADSFCDSGWSNRSHRGWTTLISFALQALVVACLLLLPLFYTQGLPRLLALTPLLVPALAPAAAHVSSHPNSFAARNNQLGMSLVTPSEIPPEISMSPEAAAPPAVDSSGLGVSRGVDDSRGSVLNAIGGSEMVLPPPPPIQTHHPPISRIMEGNLIFRVQPEYPPLARQARVEGTVVLRAMISREGLIENLQVLSGHPMLIRAAADAVRQWRYRPYLLNEEPVEVETQVTVNFVLSGGS
jgi:periplasmic protein TonB